MNELSAAQDADSNGQCLILYQMQSGNKYTLHTVSPVIRDTWFHRLQELISANRVKKDSVPRRRSASEPAEPLTRSPLVSKKSVFRRESNKKHVSKTAQHQHVDGVLSNPASAVTADDIEVQVIYIVCLLYLTCLSGSTWDTIFSAGTDCNGRRG